MTEAPPQGSRQPKLRSSCDGCGAAKLKCDRVHPECGRCVSLGMTCVYGFSRKMGKPPRKRSRTASESFPTAAAAAASAATAAGHQRDRNHSRSSASGIAYECEHPLLSHAPIMSMGDSTHPTTAMDAYPDPLASTMAPLGPDHGDLFGPLLPRFGSLEFGDGMPFSIDPSHISTLETYLNPAAIHTEIPHQSHADKHGDLSGFFPPQTDAEGHTCYQEAHEILGSLSLHASDDDLSVPQSPLGSPASSTGEGSNHVGLDRILHLNREASDRLGQLMPCSCGRSPHVALLHASIIYQILIWYQKAAGFVPSVPWDTSSMALDPTNSQHVFPTGPSSPNDSSAWSNSTGSIFSPSGTKNATTPASSSHSSSSSGLTGAAGGGAPAVASSKVAIGSFNVDDLRVQTALKIQLLSGEVRRAGALMDQFTLHNSSDGSGSGNGQFRLDNKYTFGPGSVKTLLDSLDSWLRAEHTRVANMMRSKLRELNA